MTRIVELYTMGVGRKNARDKRVAQSVALILPEEGYGPCYLVVIERDREGSEYVIPLEAALPQVANAYLGLEAITGRAEAWARTLKEDCW